MTNRYTPVNRQSRRFCSQVQVCDTFTDSERYFYTYLPLLLTQHTYTMAVSGLMGRGSIAELAPGAVSSPPKLDIPPKTQICVIGSLICVGIGHFFTTDCSMMSYYYLLLTMVVCHRYHATTILITVHLSPGPTGILSRV